MSVLELEEVEVVYERRDNVRVTAVAGASLTVERGQIVGLVGESGCGKSTLARTAVGLVARSAGRVRFEGKDVPPLTRRSRPRALTRLQLVFQNPYSSLNPRRRVGDQIGDGIASSSRAERGRRIAELLELVGLPENAAGRFPSQFSGGQRQRIAIARALAADPSLLILDEPMASLDASAQAQVANLLVDLSRRLSLSLLLISHDLAIVRHAADVVSVMYLGRIVETGPIRDVWPAPLHPYTEALIAAVPHADGSGTMPEALPGEVPDPARPPAGCRFHPRCPHVFERCIVEQPTLEAAFGNRASACWLPYGETPTPPSSRAPIAQRGEAAATTTAACARKA
jgi:oligopeptide/dipeptide ABC transporter ATP-binding protein